MESKTAGASLLSLQQSDISSQNHQSSCSLILHLPFQDIIPFAFPPVTEKGWLADQ